MDKHLSDTCIVVEFIKMLMRTISSRISNTRYKVPQNVEQCKYRRQNIFALLAKMIHQNEKVYSLELLSSQWPN